MRVLIVHNRYQQRGGEDAVFEAEAELLSDAGHHVIKYEVFNDNVRGFRGIVSAVSSSLAGGPAIQELRALVEQHKPDVVHIHNFFPLLSPFVFSELRKMQVPAVLTLHNFRTFCASGVLMRDGRICEKCLKGSAVWGAAHRCYRGSVPGSMTVASMIALHRWLATWNTSVDRFITLTEFSRSKFLEAGFPERKLAMKPNFVMDPTSGATRALSNRHGGVFVGRISKEKGLDLLLQAWKDIDYPLTIVGDGPDLARLSQSAPANVIFRGKLGRNEVVAEMRQARFLLMPSQWYEGFPMTLLEAYSVGLPVIASDIGSLGELVHDGKTGILAPPTELEGWRAAARAVASDDALWARLSTGARQVYEERYKPARNLDLLQKIYLDAISEAKLRN